MFSKVNRRPSNRIATVWVIALLGVLSLMLMSAKAPDAVVTIDWETDSNGAALRTGQIIDTEFSTAATPFTVSATGGVGDAVIFDSANPTGGDADLGTPNNAFGGPGVSNGSGDGGASNTVAQGNVLIVQENSNDGFNGFGDYNDPDDAVGVVITLTFQDPIIPVSSDFLDQESSEPVTVSGFLGGVQQGSALPVIGLGDNSAETLDLSSLGPVDELVFDFGGSGAISAVVYDDPSITAISLSSFNPVAGGQMGIFTLIAIALLGVTTLVLFAQARPARRVA